MSVTLDKMLINSETRIRLIFSGALASGAFSAALYAVSCVTLESAGPVVAAALAVSGATNQVELVLATALASGNTFAVNCTAVPAADLSTCTAALAGYFGPNVTFIPNVEPEQNTGDALTFGRDLVHNGQDYVEDASGDLVTVEGIPNVEGALFRRVLGYGLPWDQTYGPKLEDYVDGPNASAAPATGLIKQQVLADDRVQACACTLLEDDTAAGGAFFHITPTLRTDRRIGPFDIAVSDVTSTGDSSA